MTEALDGFVNQPHTISFQRHVGLHQQGLGAEFFAVLNDLAGQGFALVVIDDQAVTCGCQLHGTGRAYAAAAAGDDENPFLIFTHGA